MSVSLRRRAVIGGLALAATVLAVGGGFLYLYLGQVATERFDAALRDRLTEIAVVLSAVADQPEALGDVLSDPAYIRPYSGRYWQAEGPGGLVLTSRSLFDATLTPPSEAAKAEPGLVWEGQGPQEPVRALTQALTLESGTVWLVTVAESQIGALAERTRVRNSLVVAFGVFGALAVLGAAAQISLALRPLLRLRDDVAGRWESGERLSPEAYPNEVSPLVTELNDLLDRNTTIIEKARRQAADLAHALNTPSAILRNELDAMAEEGVDTTRSAEALDRIDAQISRSLARIRAANLGASASRDAVPVADSVRRLGRVFQHQLDDRGLTLSSDGVVPCEAFMDRQDLEETLGNLIDNALKWCRRQVAISAAGSGEGISVTVADDGPGIAPEQQREALRAGGRLDTATPGTGLGLAIARDLVEAYGGSLALETATDLGGLAVVVRLPGRAVA